ncbi:GRF zinc finger [Dictyocaulus viviparus]|uniref:GRF zinc finger n=1 Tax=Dictyocaulus viviparus TaxID=29172 RepID=A0A0D8XWI1_DICVI|nr:GRF zinc finger [Dictyocaulus viviparus]
MKSVLGAFNTKSLKVLDEQLGKYRRIFLETELKINLLSEMLQKYLNSNSNPLVDNSVRPAANRRVVGRREGTGINFQGHDQQSSRSEVMQEFTTMRFLRTSLEHVVDDNEEHEVQDVMWTRKAIATSRRGPLSGTETANKVCNCGALAVQRTVMKEGQNKGRKFWTCAKPVGQPQKCNFFQWA